ncbi:MAG: metal-dependent hydrolase [Oligoflexia bacterium]|nr:metal-dependent hydrolase [Oligoflexia bacterium]
MKILIGIMALLLSATSAFAQAGQIARTEVQFLGHAAFEITTPKGAVLIIDPWLSNPMNPAAQNGKDPLASIAKCDYILITHGHFDHMAEAVALAKKTGAKLVTNFDLAANLVNFSGFPEKQAGMETNGNIGGAIMLANGEVTVHFVPAVHSSGLDVKTANGKSETVYGGNPVGFVLEIKDGPKIYDTGDTAYFDDMKLIGDAYAPDLALINIGGHFGMEPEMAAKAAVAVKAKLVVPHHYKTFPLLTQSAEQFFLLLDRHHIAHRELSPGATLVFEGKKPLK